MLTNNPNFVLNFNQVSAPGFSKHDIIYSSINICRSHNESVRTYRDFKNVNLPGLLDAFNAFDWNLLYSITDSDIALNLFNNRLLDLYNQFVLIREVKPKNNPWFNAQISHAIMERDIAYRVWVSDRTTTNHNQYKRLRNKVTSLINTAKSNYVSNRLSTSNSTKELWGKLKNLNVGKSVENNNKFNNNSDEINNYFASNFTPDTENPSIPSENEYGLKFATINENDVILAIKSIKSNAVGLDEIPLSFIKLLLPSILPAICYIFNLIITSSKFPEAWKAAKVIPIKKKPNDVNLSNLRPISILSALSKVFERILQLQIRDHLENFDLLTQFQSGFRRGRSTTTAMLKVHDDIHSVVDKKGVAFLLLIDFSKAFDRVSHVKLLKKLSDQFLFSRSAVYLIQSYLSKRSQVVVANDRVSAQIPIISGVPQGSILGPLLFSLFINDLPSVLKYCKIHLFADDVQLYFCSNSIPVSQMAQFVNADLLRVFRWSQTNLLPINTSKTKAMFIKRNQLNISLPSLMLGQDRLEYVDKISNLGFIMQDDLEWDSHVNAQCRKIYNGLRLLRLSTSMLSPATKLSLFKSLLLPHFMYGDVLLLNASARAIDRLRVALNCCVRYVFNVSRLARVTHLQPKLLGCHFYDFIKLRSCFTLFNIINSSSPEYLFNKLTPFQSNRVRSYVIPRYNSSHYANTLFVRGICRFNLLPNEIKNIRARSEFRRECLEWFNRRNQQQ
uniref:Putative outcast ele5 orf1-h 1e-40-j 4 n=1 Tax=Psorophora albipes TaxID=869069 RepID=T1DE06_9DIPT